MKKSVNLKYALAPILYPSGCPHDFSLLSTSGNTSLMQMIGGGTLSVRGTENPDKKYYIRSGQIQGEAPDLTQEEVVI